MHASSRSAWLSLYDVGNPLSIRGPNEASEPCRCSPGSTAMAFAAAAAVAASARAAATVRALRAMFDFMRSPQE